MQQLMRHWQRPAAIAVVLALCVPGHAAISVRILGEPADISPAPQVTDGVLIGAPAPIAGKLGCRFMSEDKGGLLIVTPGGRRITITPGRTALDVDGTAVTMPRKALEAGGEVICPLMPVLEAIGAVPRWDEEAEVLEIGVPLEAVTVHADEEGARVRVRTSLRVKGALCFIEDPPRYYVDLPGVGVALKHEQTYVNRGKLLRVRWGQFQHDPPVGRMVADVREEADVRWEADEDGLGGSLLIGEVDGDEPLIERHVPKITGLATRTPDEDTTIVHVELTDPLLFEYDVEREPPRVVLQLPDAAPAIPTDPIEVDGPFVRAAKLDGEPDTPGSSLTLQMHQLIHFDVASTDDPPSVDLVFRRGDLADKRIVIDPGHGGRDTGALGKHLEEKQVNLDVAFQVAAGLMEEGAQTVLTRESDVFVDLYDRPELANRLDADLFVSIHCNAMPRPNTGWGTETYYYHEHSQCLGQIMQSELMRALGRRDNGLRWANFCVTRETQMPAVLVELMYLNHDEEEALLQKPQVRTAAAAAIVEGLRRYVEGTASPAEASELGM